VISNGDIGYLDPHLGENRTLFLDPSLNVFKSLAVRGEGHYPVCFDADADGYDEFFLGYCLFDHDGSLMWIVDCWRDRELVGNSRFNDHTDQKWIYRKDDESDWQAVIAGGDYLYLVDSQGNTIWRRKGIHNQFLCVGKFLVDDSQDYIFVLNNRFEMVLYDMEGTIRWKGLLPENWPLGKPATVWRYLHIGRPMSLWHNPLDNGQDLLVYNEAGWPYAVDGLGNAVVTFPCPESARLPETFSLPGFPQVDKTPTRPDDWGFAYYARVADVDGDGKEEVIIYNRQHCWIYEVPP
jgi:hypothetical protein